MVDYISANDLAGYFEGKKLPKLAGIFRRIDDDVTLAQAVVLASHHDYTLTAKEIAKYIRQEKPEPAKKEEAKDYKYEVRASDIVEYFGLMEEQFGEDYCQHKAEKFKPLGSKPLSRKEALRLLPERSKKLEWRKIITADIEAMYLAGPAAVINRARSEKHRGKDRGLNWQDFSPESPRGIGRGENPSNDNAGRIREG